MTIMMIAHEDEIAEIRQLFDKQSESGVTGRLSPFGMRYNTDGGIVYYYDEETEDWEIFNFYNNTTERVEGDLAGLCNAAKGNFPF